MNAGPSFGPLRADLALRPDAGGVLGSVPELWGTPHVFGGYLACLLVSAAARVAAHPELLDVHVTFVERVRVGRVRLVVDEVRRSRGAWVGRVVMTQADRVTATAEVWTGPSGTLRAGEGTGSPPDGAREPRWLLERFPFMAAFDLRAAAHPIDASRDVDDPPPHVEVWGRARDELEARTPLERQLLTLLLVDAHILGASLRPHGWEGSGGGTHTLSVTWTALPARGGWFGIDATAAPGHPHTAARAQVDGRDGPVAWALSSGRVFPGEGRGDPGPS